jgi:hypothetical protein
LYCFLILSLEKSNRDIYPKTLVGGFELLALEQTGIDFNNMIKESKYFNHYLFGQIYVGSGVTIGDFR